MFYLGIVVDLPKSFKDSKEFHGGFSGGSDSKEYTCNAGDLGLIPGLGISPGGGHSNSIQHSCLENPHGQRSLAGYSPWRRKESDMTERLSTAQHQLCIRHKGIHSIYKVVVRT